MSNNQAPRVCVIVPNGAAVPNSGSTSLVLLNADGSVASTIKKQAAQADSTATDVPGLKTDFNALLAKLRLAGVIA